MYVSNAERNRELKHHGILGMKWGKRQGPPYPLNPADHSAAEKKAGYQKSIDKGSSSGTDKKSSDDSSSVEKRIEDIDKQIEGLDKEKNELIEAEIKKKYGMSRGEAYAKAINDDNTKMMFDITEIEDRFEEERWKKRNELTKQKRDLKDQTELKHHGVIGMKWGVRRYQPYGTGYTPKNKGYSAKESYRELSKKLDKIYDDNATEFDKLHDEKWNYIEKQIKKKTGLSYDEAFNKAASTNNDLDTGKIKYEDTLWPIINSVEYDAEDKFESRFQNQREKFKKEKLKASEEFIDSYMEKMKKEKVSIDELVKLSDKHWNGEHQEYTHDGSIYVLEDIFDNSQKYMYDWDEDFSIKKR